MNTNYESPEIEFDYEEAGSPSMTAFPALPVAEPYMATVVAGASHQHPITLTDSLDSELPLKHNVHKQEKKPEIPIPSSLNEPVKIEHYQVDDYDYQDRSPDLTPDSLFSENIFVDGKDSFRMDEDTAQTRLMQNSWSSNLIKKEIPMSIDLNDEPSNPPTDFFQNTAEADFFIDSLLASPETPVKTQVPSFDPSTLIPPARGLMSSAQFFATKRTAYPENNAIYTKITLKKLAEFENYIKPYLPCFNKGQSIPAFDNALEACIHSLQELIKNVSDIESISNKITNLNAKKNFLHRIIASGMKTSPRQKACTWPCDIQFLETKVKMEERTRFINLLVDSRGQAYRSGMTRRLDIFWPAIQNTADFVIQNQAPRIDANSTFIEPAFADKKQETFMESRFGTKEHFVSITQFIEMVKNLSEERGAVIIPVDLCNIFENYCINSLKALDLDMNSISFVNLFMDDRCSYYFLRILAFKDVTFRESQDIDQVFLRKIIKTEMDLHTLATLETSEGGDFLLEKIKNCGIYPPSNTPVFHAQQRNGLFLPQNRANNSGTQGLAQKDDERAYEYK